MKKRPAKNKNHPSMINAEEIQRESEKKRQRSSGWPAPSRTDGYQESYSQYVPLTEVVATLYDSRFEDLPSQLHSRIRFAYPPGLTDWNRLEPEQRRSLAEQYDASRDPDNWEPQERMVNLLLRRKDLERELRGIDLLKDEDDPLKIEAKMRLRANAASLLAENASEISEAASGPRVIASESEPQVGVTTNIDNVADTILSNSPEPAPPSSNPPPPKSGKLSDQVSAESAAIHCR